MRWLSGRSSCCWRGAHCVGRPSPWQSDATVQLGSPMGHGSSVMTGVDGGTERDRFDPSASPLVSRDLVDGYNILAQVPSCRQAFMRYVKSGAWMNNATDRALIVSSFSSLQLEQASGEISRRIDSYVLPRGAFDRGVTKKSFSIEDIKRSVSKRFEECLQHDFCCVVEEEDRIPAMDSTTRDLPDVPVSPTTTSPELGKTFDFNDVPPPRSPRRAASDFLFSDDQMKDIVFAYLFPLFLRSKEFNDWMANKPPESEQPNEELLASSSDDDGDRLCTAVLRVAQSLQEKEIEEILESGNWMSGFISTVEDLDLCVSLSKVESSFPLIYVNKAFEQLTGYGREEVLGKNCRFLQCAQTEETQIQKMREALKSHQGVKVALTNARKDGSEFINFLALHPVFNPQGKCIYVIGVQYDATHPAACKNDLKKVDELLRVLPRILQ